MKTSGLRLFAPLDALQQRWFGPRNKLVMLAYASAIPAPLKAGTVARIKAAIERHNAKAGITGRLLFANGLFFQVLEGPDDAVRELFDVIRRDERHVRVVELFRRPIVQRRYSDFEMRFDTDRESRLFDRFVRYILLRAAVVANDAPDDARRLVRYLRNSLVAPAASLPDARRKLVAVLPSVRFASADRDVGAVAVRPTPTHTQINVPTFRQPLARSPVLTAFAPSDSMPFVRVGVPTLTHTNSNL